MDPTPINAGRISPSTNLPTIMERGHEIAEEARDAVANRPVVAMIAAGAIGFAVGAVIFKSRNRKNDFGRFGAVQRAAELAGSGAASTLQGIRRKLRQEGYSPSEVRGQANRYLRQLIAATRRSIGA